VPKLTVRRAAAEFAIIVTGVMVALAADAWLEGMREASQERKILESLLGEVEADAADLQRRIARLDRQAALQVRIDSVARRDLPVDDSVGLLRDLAAASDYATFDARTSVVDDLLSTGRIGLIGNDELRDRVLSYYNRVDDVAEADAAQRVEVMASFREHVPTSLRGLGLSIAYQERSYLGVVPDTAEGAWFRSEAALAVASPEDGGAAELSQFLLLARSWTVRARTLYRGLEVLASELAVALGRELGASRGAS